MRIISKKTLYNISIDWVFKVSIPLTLVNGNAYFPGESRVYASR